MSQTVPVDVMSGAYWEYVASAMVEGLGKILEDSQTPAAAISRRVYVDAHRFFDLALEAAGDTLPKNPSASIANYILAANAANVRVRSTADRDTLRTRLVEYAGLVGILAQGNRPQAIDTLTGLRDFFREVQHDAEAEAYRMLATNEAQTISFRVR